MPIINRTDFRALPIQTVNTFAANFNNPPGAYSFGVLAANTGALVMPLDPNYVYLIDSCSFSCTVEEGEYLLGTTAIPQARLRFTLGTRAYPKPIPCVNYADGLAFAYWFYTKKTGDNLLVDMTGIITQTAAMVGIPTITAQLSLVIYQISNRKIVDTIMGKVGDSEFYEEI
jgi:hypothetical protein